MWKRANLKYLLLALLAFVGIHYFLVLTHPSDEAAKSPLDEPNGNEETSALPSPLPKLPISSLKNVTKSQRVKAAFVVLARNSDLHRLRSSMRQMEDRFNHKYNYPWVFLNDGEFTEEFKTFTSAMTKGKTMYGLIPKEHWSVPSWVDYSKAQAEMKKMEEAGVIYGGSESYRHMCRFESGFFFRHPLLDEYDYYWRVEPGIYYHCDIDFDPFVYMKDKGIKYGFTITLLEYMETIPTLWSAVREFMKEYPQYIAEDNSLELITDDSGESYNRCHFWSNFEIGDLNFWRGEAYMKFFEFLDQKGGFFYERWGDAPVHSIAAALFLNKKEIHFFNEIGYTHDLFTHCPPERELQMKCHCNPAVNSDFQYYSCTKKWIDLFEH